MSWHAGPEHPDYRHGPRPLDRHEVVTSYATTALRLWAAGTPPHDRDACRCLICSDGRRYLGERPLRPSLGRAR